MPQAARDQHDKVKVKIHGAGKVSHQASDIFSKLDKLENPEPLQSYSDFQTPSQSRARSAASRAASSTKSLKFSELEDPLQGRWPPSGDGRIGHGRKLKRRVTAPAITSMAPELRKGSQSSIGKWLPGSHRKHSMMTVLGARNSSASGSRTTIASASGSRAAGEGAKGSLQGGHAIDRGDAGT